MDQLWAALASGHNLQKPEATATYLRSERSKSVNSSSNQCRASPNLLSLLYFSYGPQDGSCIWGCNATDLRPVTAKEAVSGLGLVLRSDKVAHAVAY